MVFPYINMNQQWVHMCPPILNALPPYSPLYSSGLSKSAVLLHASNFHWSPILYMVISISMLFSQIIPLSPSPRVQNSVLYVFVSFAAMHIKSSLPSF